LTIDLGFDRVGSSDEKGRVMPRNAVTRSYTKATPRPVRAAVAPLALATPKGLSPLAKYLSDNEDSGLSTKELIEQFQEYDCSHPEWDVLASSLTYLIRKCKFCGKQEKKFKPGENP
jgi:hypothetical protein